MCIHKYMYVCIYKYIYTYISFLSSGTRAMEGGDGGQPRTYILIYIHVCVCVYIYILLGGVS